MTKFYVTIFLIFAGFCAANMVLAQAGVPMSLRGDFNRMQTNFAAKNQMSMQRMMNQPWYIGSEYLINPTYTFKVMMKDSSIVNVTSKIHADTGTRKSYLVYVNKTLKRSDPMRETKIYPQQTLSVSRKEESERNGYYDVKGIPTDSCWLFKIGSGKINIYSHLSEVDMLNNMYLKAFQVGNGQIQKVDSAALVSVIKDDPKAMKAFKKKDYYNAIDKFNGDK